MQKSLRRSLSILVSATALVGVLSACGGSQLGDTGTAAAAVTEVMEVTVNILGNRFDPRSVTVPAGSTITWHNTTSADHSITCSEFDAALRPGQDYSYTFNNTGEYDVESTSHSEGSDLNTIVTVE